MISESELIKLSYPEAPKMITKVPGPKVQKLMRSPPDMKPCPAVGGTFPVILEEGKGATVKDPDGNIYIDMAAGVAVNAVGRGHPKVLEAIHNQSGTIMHTTDITNPKSIELAKKVSGVMPEGLGATARPPSPKAAAAPSRRPLSLLAITPAVRKSSPSTALITGSGAALPP